MTDSTSPQSPVEWLISAFEATDPSDICLREEQEGQWPVGGQVHVQPMLSFADSADDGDPMLVTSSDYRDSGRVWL